MDISINQIQLFQILKQKLGDKEAEALVTFVETKVKEESTHNLNVIATKVDIALVKDGITKLDVKISETKSDIIKWMFIFWIGSISVITGILFAMLHSFIK
ncbi:MAG: hypothetical protein WCP52_11780 [Bacteroidota bacterium]